MTELKTLPRRAPAAPAVETPAPSPRLFFGTRANVIAASLFGVMLLVAYVPTLIEWFSQCWKYSAEYGHCLLMPPVAGWMIWCQRARLKAMKATRRSIVFALVAALAFLPGALALLLGEMKLSWFLKPYSLFGSIVACAALLWGWRGLVALRRPLVVLFLACPIPWRILIWATVPLKRHATVLATGLIDATGLGATLEGNLIHVEGINSLWIADACSGVRSLVSLLAVAIVGCLFWRRHWTIKGALIASCVPLAVFANGFRIWLTAFLAVHVSPKAAEAAGDWFRGFALFFVSAALLWGWGWILNRFLPRRDVAEDAEDEEAPAPEPVLPPARLRPSYAIVGAGVLALCLMAAGSFGAYRIRARLGGDATVDTAAITRLQDSFKSFPLEVGSYRGKDRFLDAKVIDASGADAYRSIDFTGADGRGFQVYLGGALRNADNFHAPNVCMPSAGWEVLAVEAVPAPLPTADGSTPRIQRMLMQKGPEQMVVYYWFQAGSTLASNEWQVRYQRLFELLRQKPLSATQIVSIYVPVQGGIEETQKAGRAFLADIAPYLREATASGGNHGQK